MRFSGEYPAKRVEEICVWNVKVGAAVIEYELTARASISDRRSEWLIPIQNPRGGVRQITDG